MSIDLSLLIVIQSCLPLNTILTAILLSGCEQNKTVNKKPVLNTYNIQVRYTDNTLDTIALKRYLEPELRLVSQNNVICLATINMQWGNFDYLVCNVKTFKFIDK